MNNSVYRGDELVGFRCSTCGGVFQSMFGTTCNGCEAVERRHEEMIAAIKEAKNLTNTN